MCSRRQRKVQEVFFVSIVVLKENESSVLRDISFTEEDSLRGESYNVRFLAVYIFYHDNKEQGRSLLLKGNLSETEAVFLA